MNPYTGEVLRADKIKELSAEQQKLFKPIDIAQLSDKSRKLLLQTGKTYLSRNSRCPCGSGRRFKNCCYEGVSQREERSDDE